MPTLHRFIRAGLFAVVGAGAVLALGVACGTRNLTDGASTGTNPTTTTGGDCAPGHPGCPCDVPGQTVDCGTEVTTSGDYVMCSMGTSVCQDGKWGACQGHTLKAKSRTVSRIDGNSRHVHHKAVSCPQTPDAGYGCDPNRCPPVVEPMGDVDAAGFVASDAGVSLTPACSNLSCQVQSCVGNPFDAAPDAYAPATTITGKVFDPAGKNPLNNVSVYIPNDPAAPLPAFVAGPTCDPCTYAGGAAAPATVAVTQTAPDGTFTLTNVPSGANIPIVVQVGKWRRKITLPNVAPCTTNKIADGTLHLPRNHTDGDNATADLPQIAFVVGGGPDDLECLLLKMGLDPNEFGSLSMNPARRLHYYESPDKPWTPLDPGFGNNPTGDVLWSNAANLGLYDLVILGCDGNDYTGFGRSPGGYQNLTNYANGGGRVFLSHYSRSWMLENTYAGGGTPWNAVAAGGWPPSWALPNPMTATIDQSTPQGQAFAQWLANVGAASAGTIQIQTPHQSTVSPLAPGVRSLMSGQGHFAQPDGSFAFSPNYQFDTPFGGDAGDGGGACGRVVFADYHVSSADIFTSQPSCSTNADCGYGSTCNVTGGLAHCNADPCYPTTVNTSAACGGDPKYTCTGATKGTCGCTVTADCTVVGGGTCVGGNCSVATCYANSDCTSGPMQCNGSALGICTPNTCTTDADCTGNGSFEHCYMGKCDGCYTYNNCPGNETCQSNGAGMCTGNYANAPYACKQSPMTPQEAALEYQLFDLGACVVPVAPAPKYYAQASFTEDLAGTCPQGQIPVWRELDWYAQVPNTSSIQFYAQTAPQPTDGGPPDWTPANAPLVPVYTATTSNLPPNNAGRVLIDVGPGGPLAPDAGPVDAGMPGAFLVAMPPVSSLADLRLTIKMTPTTDMLATPILYEWSINWDCTPRE
jgi:hypothetical protein